MDDSARFVNGSGDIKYAPKMTYYAEIEQRVDYGFDFKPVGTVDIDLIRNWFAEFENRYGHLKYVCIDNDDYNEYGAIYIKDSYIYNLSDDMIDGYLLDIKNSLPFNTYSYRIVCHKPGMKLAMHQDINDAIRMHIPLYTNELSTWTIESQEYHMQVGQIYLVNSTLPHGVYNKGTTDRIHIYCKAIV